MNDKPQKEDHLTLQLLEVIGRRSDVSQRDLARQMGVALGLANSYLKRCVRKGLVKIREAPANRYLYYLTPHGFSEKSRLTAQYLAHSFSFYRQAGDSCRRAFAVCKHQGWRRVLLCGVSDLAEIASVRALEADIEIIGTYDSQASGSRFMNRPVWKSFDDVLPHEAALLTNLNGVAGAYEHLISKLERDRILVPDILGLGEPAGSEGQ